MITTDEMRILLSINGAATYTTTINQITNVTENYNKTVTNLMSTLKKFVSAGIMVQFGKQCLEAAENYRKATGIINTAFGSNSDAVNKWAKENAANFGLTQTAAKNYIGTYGLLAEQFNFTEDQAATMGKELAKLAGDLSSFYGVSDSAAAEKLKAVFTGNVRALKDYGIVMTNTQLEEFALSKGIALSVNQMSEQTKVALRYQYVMEKTAAIQGHFSRNSDNLTNSTKKMKIELEQLRVEVGAQLLPVAISGLQTLTSLIKAVSPTIVKVAEYVRLYAQAWQNASERTKDFARIAIGCFVVLAVYPTILKLIDRAVKILTIDVFTLKGALSLLGLAFAALAFKDLTDSVKEMKSSGGVADQIAALEQSAAAGSIAVGDLADSMDDLGQSTKGLETFLTSFDEVNKVGGSGSSIMSKLVTVDDISNILDMADSVDDLQSALDSVELPELTPTLGSIFDGDFWTGLAEDVMGFLDTFFVPSEFWENWRNGFKDVCDAVYAFDNWIAEHAPAWHDFFQSIGTTGWDLSHDSSGHAKTVGAMAADTLLGAQTDDAETFKFMRNGVLREALKYNLDGSYTDLYQKYGGAQAHSSGGGSSAPIVVQSDIYLDSEKITKKVTQNMNRQKRSAGSSVIYD